MGEGEWRSEGARTKRTTTSFLAHLNLPLQTKMIIHVINTSEMRKQYLGRTSLGDSADII